MVASPTTARLMILAAGILFSTGGAAVKACHGLTGVEVAGLRSGIAAILLLVFLPESRKLPDRGVILTAIAYAGMLTLFATSSKLTTAANAVFLQGTAPLYVLLLGPVLLKEHVARRDLAILALIALGMTAFFIASEAPTATAPDPVLGNLLAAASGLAWALTLMGLRALGKRSENAAARAAVLGNVLAFAFNAPFMSPDRLAAASVLDWSMIAWLGLFQIGLAYVLISRAVPLVPAFAVTLILMSEPAFNPVWTWVVHSEVPSALAIAGGTVICSALVLKSWLDAPSAR